jgi:hypothetical protein
VSLHALARRALDRLAAGRVSAALHLLRAAGPRFCWGVHLLRVVRAARGARRARLEGLLVHLLRRASERVGPASVNAERFHAIMTANQAWNASWVGALASALAAAAGDVARWISQWLLFIPRGGTVPLAVPILVALAVGAFLVFRAGPLVPRGMRNASAVTPARAPTAQDWRRRAVEAWNSGDVLDALRFGRTALVLAWSMAGTPVRPGFSDRELERVSPDAGRAEFRRFRLAYARIRWAGDLALAGDAWAALGHLWEARP